MSNANNAAPVAFTTDIAKLPRTKKAARLGVSDSDCACCAESLLSPEFFVVTEQGEYPIGACCAKKAKKAGFEIVAA